MPMHRRAATLRVPFADAKLRGRVAVTGGKKGGKEKKVRSDTSPPAAMAHGDPQIPERAGLRKV